MKRIMALLVLSTLLSACSFLGVRSGYQQPEYEIVGRVGESIEIRSYGSRLAAEASIESSDSGEGRNASFRLLFDYISGGNRTGASIAMTAPVESDGASEEIAMTAPVETARTDESRVYMRFFLPAKYDRETVPKPTDARVRIVEVPAQTLAVLRFTGFGSEESVAKKKAELLRGLEGSSWRPESQAVAYFYDPPWTLPFFRRNEVVVAVTQQIMGDRL
jgi:hypothetical protein